MGEIATTEGEEESSVKLDASFRFIPLADQCSLLYPESIFSNTSNRFFIFCDPDLHALLLLAGSRGCPLFTPVYAFQPFSFHCDLITKLKEVMFEITFSNLDITQKRFDVFSSNFFSVGF